ncbi:MAG TPA: helix-turn-helix transcriptional regulator [Candidatus Stercorousia faecigallinarum]|nr:helix-turn-helix transcriptional regulator [Candidatus Stercorousia faecigallinarum]
MKQNSKKLIAKNVKKYREKLHLKKEELSLKAGFDNSYISKLEANKMNITIEKLDIIADALNINTKDLFD